MSQDAAARAEGRTGAGRIAIELVAGCSAITACQGGDPLKLLPVVNRGPCAWIAPTTYGGGLLGGDDIGLDIAVGAGARLLLTSQASTKVYRSLGGTARWSVRATVAAGGILTALPEPVAPFAGARYRQDIAIDLAEDASLVWLDGLTAGRTARGERWAAEAIDLALTIRRAGRPLLIDRLRLHATPPFGLGGMAMLATVVVAGPAVAAIAEAVRSAEGHTGVLITAHALPTAGDAVILRLAGPDTDAATRILRTALAGCAGLVGSDPFAGR